MALTVEIVGPNMAQQNMGACLLFSSMGGMDTELSKFPKG